MRTRIAASIVIAAGLLLGSTGCTFFSPIATEITYDPSDGVGSDVAGLNVRNAIAISEDGDTANLILVIVNSTSSTAKVGLQYESNGEKVTETVLVSAGETMSFGTGDVAAIALTGIDTALGGLLPVYVQSGSDPGVQLLVPVLDGTLPEYENYIPVTPAVVPAEG